MGSGEEERMCMWVREVCWEREMDGKGREGREKGRSSSLGEGVGRDG